MPWSRPLESGRYQGQYRDAQNKIQSAGTFTQAAQAKRAAAKKEAEAREPGAVDPGAGKITWGAWFDLWHNTRILAEATDATYQSLAANHIYPVWEHVRLCDIETLDIAKWVSKMHKKGRSPHLIRGVLMLMKTSLNAAVNLKRLTVNNAKPVPYPELPKGTERYLTPDEVELITFWMSGLNALIVWTLVNTGMRFGELAGLHRSRVDLKNRRIHIVEQYDQKADEVKPYPKTLEARTVALPDDLVAMLVQYLETAAPEPGETCGLRHMGGGRCTGDLLFRGPRGGVLHSNEWGRGPWKAAQRMAGITERTRVHDLRHTTASWLLQQRLTLTEVAKVLGHSREETVKKYAHWAEDETHEVVRTALTQHRLRAARRAANSDFEGLYDTSPLFDEEAV